MAPGIFKCNLKIKKYGLFCLFKISGPHGLISRALILEEEVVSPVFFFFFFLLAVTPWSSTPCSKFLVHKQDVENIVNVDQTCIPTSGLLGRRSR